MKVIKCFLFLILGGIFLVQTTVFAQRPSLILRYSYNPLKGKFDGQYILSGNGNVFEVPKLTGGNGYGIGYQSSIAEEGKRVDIELTYTRTVYRAAFESVDLGKTNCNSFGVAFKIFLPIRTTKGSVDDINKINNPVIRFFGLIGMEGGNLRVKDSYYLLSYPTFKNDANLFWTTFPFEIGISITPVKAFSLNLEGGYRLGAVNGVREVGSKEDSFSVKGNLGMNGLRCDIELLYNF